MAKITVTVFRDDIIKEKQNVSASNIDIYCIRPDRVSMNLIEDADLIIYEEGMNAKYLKKECNGR